MLKDEIKDEDDNDDECSNSTEAIIKNNIELGEMYWQDVCMIAENQINAGNSWNLKLIKNINKFLEDDEVQKVIWIP